MEETIWLRRSPEWIKENPGRGTMYRVMKNDTSIEYVSSVEHSVKKKYLKESGSAAGVYLVMCEPSKCVYVGQSINMGSRMRNHKMNIVGNLKSYERFYVKMREDYLKYGEESFQFIKYKVIDSFTTELLMVEERNVMLDFLDDGWSLYNSAVPWSNNFIYCHESYKSVIVDLIKSVKKDAAVLDKVKLLIKQ